MLIDFLFPRRCWSCDHNYSEQKCSLSQRDKISVEIIERLFQRAVGTQYSFPTLKNISYLRHISTFYFKSSEQLWSCDQQLLPHNYKARSNFILYFQLCLQLIILITAFFSVRNNLIIAFDKPLHNPLQTCLEILYRLLRLRSYRPLQG